MKILLLAGEQSGVLYANGIKRHLAASHEVRGYEDYGFSISDLAVMGLWAVLKRIGFFLRVKRTMEKAIIEWRPDVVCTIDYPGMNLKLAAFAKSRGIRAVHIVSPQVWAWKKGRIPKIEASLDKLYCFFPFEPALYKPGFAEFIGHPLVEQVSHRNQGLSSRVVALLPGSRLSEVERNLPVMLEAANRLKNIKIEIPAANPGAKSAIGKILKRCAKPQSLSITVFDGEARRVLQRADVAAVASGTATLEAALSRCPTVLVYRVGALFAWLVRRFVKEIHHIGLANIIWEKSLPEDKTTPMPELLQEDFTADNLSAILEQWLDDPNERSKAIAKLDATCRLLDSRTGSLSYIASEIETGGKVACAV